MTFTSEIGIERTCPRPLRTSAFQGNPEVEATGHDQAVTIILEGKSRHFDPDVVEAFAQINDEFKDIAGRYSD